jgi:hypothetical protein
VVPVASRHTVLHRQVVPNRQIKSISPQQVLCFSEAQRADGFGTKSAGIFRRCAGSRGRRDWDRALPGFAGLLADEGSVAGSPVKGGLVQLLQ